MHGTTWWVGSRGLAIGSFAIARCVWNAATRDLAASKLGYTDNLGNLDSTWIDYDGNPVQ